GLPAGHRAGCPGARLRSALVPWYAAAREAVRQLLQPAGPRRLVWLRDSLLPCARPRVDGAMAGRCRRRHRRRHVRDPGLRPARGDRGRGRWPSRGPGALPGRPPAFRRAPARGRVRWLPRVSDARGRLLFADHRTLSGVGRPVRSAPRRNLDRSRLPGAPDPLEACVAPSGSGAAWPWAGNGGRGGRPAAEPLPDRALPGQLLPQDRSRAGHTADGPLRGRARRTAPWPRLARGEHARSDHGGDRHRRLRNHRGDGDRVLLEHVHRAYRRFRRLADRGRGRSSVHPPAGPRAKAAEAPFGGPDSSAARYASCIPAAWRSKLKHASTRSRAAVPSAERRPRSLCSRTMALTIASTSSGGTRSPQPGATCSRMPSTALATTARPEPMASSSEIGHGSRRDGSTKTSQLANAASTSARGACSTPAAEARRRTASAHRRSSGSVAAPIIRNWTSGSVALRRAAASTNRSLPLRRDMTPTVPTTVRSRAGRSGATGG